MLFCELYSAYYNAVAAILTEALSGNTADIAPIAKKYAFGESFLTIEKALKSGAWPLLRSDGTAVVQSPPQMPLTVLQKRWLNAIALDPKIRLFCDEPPTFPDVAPLFCPEDICVFDRYADGDNYTDELYIRHFRLIMDAIRNRYPLSFHVTNRKGTVSYLTAQPEHIEYSEKDDKFRVITSGCRYGGTININHIVSCKPSGKPLPVSSVCSHQNYQRVTLEVTDERRALDRVLLHFAHFSKEAERIDEAHYRVTVEYDTDDETEIVIRVLSFGPLVRVAEPESFITLIRNRLISQKSCELM